jgi:hypothetical protein
LLVAVHWAGLLHSWPYVPGSAFWHCFISILHNGDINPVGAVAFDHHFNAVLGVFFGRAVAPCHTVAVAQYRQFSVCVFDSHVVSFHVWLSCGRATIPATTLREGLALALSRGADRDNPAGESVGLLGLAAVGSKANDLFAVGALAKGA